MLVSIGIAIEPGRQLMFGVTFTFTTAAVSQTITGLTPGKSYTFKVAAKNSFG